MSKDKAYKAVIPLQYTAEKLPEEQTHLAVYHGKVTDAMAGMSSKDATLNKITGKATIDNGEISVVIQKFNDLQASLGVNTHKLLIMGLGAFTAVNTYGTDNSIHHTITFPLAEYAKWLGEDVEKHPTATEAEALKEKKRVQRKLNEVQKRVKKELEVLVSTQIRWEENIKGKPQDFDYINILGRASVKKGVVLMEFTDTMARYFTSLNLTQYPKSLFLISGRNQNAYSLGYKFAIHHNMDSNIKRGTANRLKVENLLKVTNLPTYEQTVNNRNSWIDRIKEPFEKALGELIIAGTLTDWEYTYAKGVPLTDEEASNITDYEAFTKLYVTFEMGEEVDHTDRLARRAEEQEKRQKAKKKRKIQNKN